MLHGARKNLSNLVLDFVTYLWDTTLEAISKIQTTLKSVVYEWLGKSKNDCFLQKSIGLVKD
jgi:hypothetical protein